MMRHSFRPSLALVLTGALLLGAAGQASAAPKAPEEEETPKQKDIRKLLLLTGSDKLGAQVLVQMLGQFKQMPRFKKVPSKFWDDFQQEASVNDLIDLIVPIYDKHLSHPEVKAIIKFYKSPRAGGSPRCCQPSPRSQWSSVRPGARSSRSRSPSA